MTELNPVYPHLSSGDVIYHNKIAGQIFLLKHFENLMGNVGSQ